MYNSYFIILRRPLLKNCPKNKTHAKALDGTTTFEITKKVTIPDVSSEDCSTVDKHVCITKKDAKSTDDTKSSDKTETSSGGQLVSNAAMTGLLSYLLR